jgi:peptidoglycan-N-acetylglucosamine deacetylase
LETAITDETTRSRSWIAWVLGGVGVCLVAAVVLYLTVFTMGVRLDGNSVRLRSGTTVGDLFAKKIVNRHPGDLVAAKDHRVLRPGAGAPAFVVSGGTRLSLGDPVTSSAELMSFNGSDTIEATRVETRSVAMSVRYIGSGPVQSVISSGSDGVRELTIGTVSGEIVKKRTAVPAIPRVIRRAPLHSGVKTVALTFDDGPWPGSTKAILKILQQNGVVATFFEIGRQARNSPSLSREVADAGMEMGNHSETHPLNLGRLSAAGVAKELRYAQKDITRASGKAPTFFRPPGGNTAAAMYPVLAKLGLGWVQWDIDTGDWRRPPANKIVARVLNNVRPGAVVLMHDGGGDRSQTIKALPTIIKKLREQGYVFVTVSALSSVPHRMG